MSWALEKYSLPGTAPKPAERTKRQVPRVPTGENLAAETAARACSAVSIWGIMMAPAPTSRAWSIQISLPRGTRTTGHTPATLAARIRWGRVWKVVVPCSISSSTKS